MMETSFGVILILVLLLPLFAVLTCIPYLTRKTESFGVSIPDEAYTLPELKNMRKHYVQMMTVLSLLTVVVGIIGVSALSEEAMDMFFTLLILGYLVASFAVYLPFHFKMKRFKSTQEWKNEKKEWIVVDTQFRLRKLTYSNVWFIFPFLLPVILGMIGLTYYPYLPDQLPMQYDLQMNVIQSVEKSYAALFSLPLIQVFLTALMLGTNVAIGYAKQQIDSNRPEESLEQNRIFRLKWSAYVIGSTYLLSLLFTMIFCSMIFTLSPLLVLITTGVVISLLLIWAVLLSFKIGQGGSRIKVSASPNDERMNHDDDRFWKLGVFYFNPHDPAMIVEKRFGVGWTINFGRPLAVIILLAIIFLPFLIMLLTNGF